MANKKKNTGKQKKNRIIIIGIIIIGIIAAILAYVNYGMRKGEDKHTSVSFSDTDMKNPGQPVSQNSDLKDTVTVEIQMDDCSVTVGTEFRVAVIVTPIDDAENIVWKSGDESVLTVDQNGNVSVCGIGKTTLTATVGTTSDAVLIEGIMKNGSSQLPVYNSDSLYSSNTGKNNGNSQATDRKSTTISGSDEDKDASYSDSNSDEDVNNNTSNSDSDYGNSVSSDSMTSNSGNSGNSESITAQGNDYKGYNSTSIGNYISGDGFEQVYSNVYAYSENGTYYGEIVTQQNATIIYIKQRCAGYDTKIKEVMSKLLPETYNQVWNSYVSAKKDRTFESENRKIRIVVDRNGGHSQIVIYN